MKLYFAYQAGNKYEEQVLKRCSVRSVLVSYFDIGGDMQVSLPFSDVLVDSGAYSSGNSDKVVSLGAYTFWLQVYLKAYPQISAYVNYDVMSDPEQSRKNWLYMVEEGLEPMPVYHYGEPEEYLSQMCKEASYIGLGGIAIGTMPPEHLRGFLGRTLAQYPRHRFHVFGATPLSGFGSVSPFSADSTSWKQGRRWSRMVVQRDGAFDCVDLFRRADGFKHFFDYEALDCANIRGFLAWERSLNLGALQPQQEQRKQLPLL